jgi:hypothetical protein
VREIPSTGKKTEKRELLAVSLSLSLSLSLSGSQPENDYSMGGLGGVK